MDGEDLVSKGGSCSDRDLLFFGLMDQEFVAFD